MKKHLHAHTYAHLTLQKNIHTHIKLFRSNNNPLTVGRRRGVLKLHISCIHSRATLPSERHLIKKNKCFKTHFDILKKYMFDHNCILIKKDEMLY